MAKDERQQMAFIRLVGIAVATAGAVFVIAGVADVDTPFDEVARLVSTHTSQTMWFLAAGAAAFLGGGALALVPGD